MKTRLIFAASLLIAAFAFAAPTLIVPVTGSTAGGGGATWEGEMTFHNAGLQPATLSLTFHPAAGAPATASLTLAPRSTVTRTNAVRELFGIEEGIGAIVIESSGNATLAITSRIVNRMGNFGQDVPVLPATELLRAGSTGVLNGPADPHNGRFNFGVFAWEHSQIEWQLIRADGTLAASVIRVYPEGSQVQHNAGVSALFEVEPAANDSVQARIHEGAVIVYGSIVDVRSGDPTWVPGIRTREELASAFVGVDLDEDGTVDVTDANGDGTLDSPIVLYTGMFPTFFRVVLTGEELSLSLTESRSDVTLVDQAGTIQAWPSAALKGTTGSIVVRASDGVATADFIIPVIYR